jgi:hypothetical protein
MLHGPGQNPTGGRPRENLGGLPQPAQNLSGKGKSLRCGGRGRSWGAKNASSSEVRGHGRVRFVRLSRSSKTLPRIARRKASKDRENRNRRAVQNTSLRPGQLGASHPNETMQRSAAQPRDPTRGPGCSGHRSVLGGQCHIQLFDQAANGPRNSGKGSDPRVDCSWLEICGALSSRPG